MDFDLLLDYFEKFDREFAEKLVIEAFGEDTGLKIGSGDAENYEDKGQDTRLGGEPGETETTKEDEGKLGKAEDKEDKEEED